MVVKRRGARVATVSEKLLTADFPRWRSVIQRSASTLNSDSLKAARNAQVLDRQARATERRVMAPMAELIGARPSAARAHRQAQTRIRKVRARKLKSPRAMTPVTPRVTQGSILQVFAPPYDAVWTQQLPNSDVTQAAADANQGTFSAYANGGGDSSFAGAGVGLGYCPISDMPMAHVRPYLRYSYWWSDFSALATAHTHALLKVRAIQFGPSGQQTLSPPAEVAIMLWADGTSWYEQHGDSGEDVWPGVFQLDFPLVANQYYGIWVYCQLFADDDGTSDSTTSSANASLSVRVPFLVVEESSG
jgi:hypothetical protein